MLFRSTGPLHDPVTWYGINYSGTFKTKESPVGLVRVRLF